MKRETFHALSSRNFRRYFAGQSISLIGTWMQKTVVSWVVYSLTHSRFMLGVTLFASLFPSFLFSFLGGVAADRYNRFRLIIVTQGASMLQALLLTTLIWHGHYVAWEIIALSALLGLINAFDVPARQTIVYEMVDSEADLPNALALNSSMVNLTRLIGPGLAGFMLKRFGDTVCFGINAISYAAVIGSLLLMHLKKQEQHFQLKKIIEELKEGYHYIAGTAAIRSVLIIIAAMSLLVVPFTMLIPVYARDIYHCDAATFGVIDSVIGGGAFMAAIYLASLEHTKDLRKVLLGSILIFGTGLTCFAFLTSYQFALLFAAVSGFGMMAQITTSSTLLQTTSAKPMRGRVISYFAMAFFGMQPLGGLLIGAVSQVVGTPLTVCLEGIAAIIIGLVYWRTRFRQDLNQTGHSLSIQRRDAAS